MKEQLISFETAKLAEEKGFNFSEIEIRDSNTLKVCVNAVTRLEYFGTMKESNLIQLPTQSLLQKWLREEHKIDCRVASNSLTYHFPMNAILEEDGTQMCGPKILIRYNTHEEALEAGLQEALKLI